EESVERGVARAELNLVLARLRPLDHDVDLLVFGTDGETGLLGDLEVAELLELLEALLDRLHVHHVAFVEGELAADDLVAGRGVARDLQAAEVELVPLVELHLDVDLVVPALWVPPLRE